MWIRVVTDGCLIVERFSVEDGQVPNIRKTDINSSVINLISLTMDRLSHRVTPSKFNSAFNIQSFFSIFGP